jgi:leucine-zipper-like transcriptional regulator 1
LFNLVTDNSGFGKRGNHTGVVFDDGRGDEMWIVGGWDGRTNYYNDVFSSPNGSVWKPEAQGRFTRRYGHSSVVYKTDGDHLWVIAGKDTESGDRNDVWFYDKNDWTLATNSAQFQPRYSHTSVVFNNLMWVLGGFDASKGDAFNDVWRSNNGSSWIGGVPPDSAFPKRGGHASVVFNGPKGQRMYVLGGYDPSSGKLYNDVWSSPDGSNWELETDDAKFDPRYGLSAVVASQDGLIWVVGGTDGNRAFNDAWVSSNGVNWSQVTNLATDIDRQGHVHLDFMGRQWLLGGFVAPPPMPGDARDDVWIYP